MQKLFLYLSSLFANLNQIDEKVTTAYALWRNIIDGIRSLRGPIAAVPVPEAVRGPEPAPAAPAASVLPDEAYEDPEGRAAREDELAFAQGR